MIDLQNVWDNRVTRTERLSLIRAAKPPESLPSLVALEATLDWDHLLSSTQDVLRRLDWFAILGRQLMFERTL